MYLVPHVGTRDVPPGGYRITISATPTCYGTVCEAGAINGAQHGEWSAITDGKSLSVKLADGTPAIYVERPCAANCADSAMLHFQRHGADYVIGLKGGTRAEILAIANALRVVK